MDFSDLDSNTSYTPPPNADGNGVVDLEPPIQRHKCQRFGQHYTVKPLTSLAGSPETGIPSSLLSMSHPSNDYETRSRQLSILGRSAAPSMLRIPPAMHTSPSAYSSLTPFPLPLHVPLPAHPSVHFPFTLPISMHYPTLHNLEMPSLLTSPASRMPFHSLQFSFPSSRPSSIVCSSPSPPVRAI